MLAGAVYGADVQSIALCVHPAVGGARIPEALVLNISRIDMLMPMWFDITDTGDVRPREGCAPPYDGYRALCTSNNVLLMPIMRNFKPAKFLADMSARTAAVDAVMNAVSSYRFDGILLDIEEITKADTASHVEFAEALGARMRSEKRTFAIAVNTRSRGEWDYTRLAAASDHLFCMFYDYAGPWKKVIAPTAPMRWKENPNDIERDLTSILASGVDAKKIIFGIAFYGIDFTLNDDGSMKQAALLYHDQIERAIAGRAVESGWDADYASTWVKYIDDKKQAHIVWREDVSAYAAKTAFARSNGIRSIGIWAVTKTGGADPAIWPLLPE